MKFQIVGLLVLSVFSVVRGDRYTFTDEIDEEFPTENTFDDENYLKIVGGTTAQKNMAPWVVSLQIVLWNRYYHTCGGAILSPEWIVTAGHCIRPNDLSYEIAAGRHNLRGNENSTEQRRTVLNDFVHPGYQGGIGPNDIALVQLRYPLIFTSSVNKVNLPTVTTADEYGSATLYGWGSTSRSSNPIMPNLLQTMTAPIINTDLCRQVLRAGSVITDKNICTGPMDGRLSACSGDSGAALTKGNTIIGIVSWGLDPCGSPNSASVYTRVSKYTNWITSTISKEGKYFNRI